MLWFMAMLAVAWVLVALAGGVLRWYEYRRRRLWVLYCWGQRMRAEYRQYGHVQERTAHEAELRLSPRELDRLASSVYTRHCTLQRTLEQQPWYDPEYAQ
jgi:hypothetical protein